MSVKGKGPWYDLPKRPPLDYTATYTHIPASNGLDGTILNDKGAAPTSKSAALAETFGRGTVRMRASVPGPSNVATRICCIITLSQWFERSPLKPIL